MIKQGNRSLSAINSTNANTQSSNHWLKEFQSKLQAVAVQPRGKELFDQITSIMNTKSKYTSVQQAVVSMMERSGLQKYLEQGNKREYYQKIAQEIQQAGQHATSIEPATKDKTPEVIQEKPEVLQTLENIIKDSHGNMTIPAIIDRLHSLYAKDISDKAVWDDDKLVRLVSKLNLEEKQNHSFQSDNYHSLGKSNTNLDDSELDRSNTDAFSVLMPAKI